MPAPRSPFDDPVPRGQRVVLATLRIAVALGCWGAAGAWLSLGNDFGLAAALVKYGGLSAPLASSLLDKTSWALVGCGLLTLVRPCWPVLLPVTIVFIAFAAVEPVVGGEWTPPLTQAARYLTPLALLLLDFWPPRVKFSLGRAMVGLFFLRLGIVLTFAGEGFLALQQSRGGGPLAGQLDRALVNVFFWQGTSEQVQTTLGVIGGLYVGLALGLLLVRSRGIALLMAIVAGLAAMSYVVALGPDAWPQTLLHAPQAGAAFALFLHWWLAVKEQPAVTIPA